MEKEMTNNKLINYKKYFVKKILHFAVIVIIAFLVLSHLNMQPMRFTRITYTSLPGIGTGAARVDGGGCWDFQYARDLRAENMVLPEYSYNVEVRVCKLWLVANKII